jgi:hypothetical protein
MTSARVECVGAKQGIYLRSAQRPSSRSRPRLHPLVRLVDAMPRLEAGALDSENASAQVFESVIAMSRGGRRRRHQEGDAPIPGAPGRAAIERAPLRRGGIREDRNATPRVLPDKLTDASEPSLGSSPDSAEGVLRGWAALFMNRTLATGFHNKTPHTVYLLCSITPSPAKIKKNRTRQEQTPCDRQHGRHAFIRARPHPDHKEQRN